MNLLLMLTAWGAFFHPAPIWDQFRNFKPDPVYYGPPLPHWRAVECAVSDQTCLEKHDDNVLTLAVMAGDVHLCWNATVPARCADSVRMVLGDVKLLSKEDAK